MSLRRTMMAGGATVTAYLDDLAVLPAAAWSVKKKLISSAVNAMRVRRSSDNAEMDVGFSDSLVDTDGMLAWSGSDSVYLKTLNDQTGNGEDWNQATTTKQPRIANAGVLDAGIQPDGVDDFMQLTSLALGSAVLDTHWRIAQPLGAAQKMLLETTAIYSSASTVSIDQFQSKLRGLANSSSGGNTYRLNAFAISASMSTVSMLINRALTGSGEIACWQNGSSLVPTSGGSFEQTGTFATNDAYLFARAGTSLFNNCTLAGMAFYTTDTAAIRSQIEAIIG